MSSMGFRYYNSLNIRPSKLRCPLVAISEYLCKRVSITLTECGMFSRACPDFSGLLEKLLMVIC